MLRVSNEFVEYLNSIISKRTFVENLFSFFGVLNYCPDQLKKEYESAIAFAHLHNTPEEIFSSAVLLSAIVFLISIGFYMVLGFNTFIIFVGILLSGFTFYYIYQYPFMAATAFRLEATSEMMLAVIYMGISIKATPNLEKAIFFAASNLTGPLAKDLAKVLWDVYTGRHVSVLESLDEFIEKWKHENEEFTEAVLILKNAFSQQSLGIDRAVDEAINVMLEETKSRMEKNVREMKSPLVVMNAFGILLPILGMMFIPIVSMFVPELFDLPITIFTYNFLLPWFVFWYASTYLERRPYTFHQPEIPEEKSRKYSTASLIILFASILLSVVAFLPGILNEKSAFINSILFLTGVSLGIASFFFVRSYFLLDFRNKIVEMEREIGEFIFMLGLNLSKGVPIEEGLENLREKLKLLIIKELVDKILYNIKALGMNFKSALFHPEYGAMKEFPSRILSAIMKVFAEISTRGSIYLSQSLISISKYLKNMRKVEDKLMDEMSEIAMNLKLQAWLLAPIASAIVVALIAVLSNILQSVSGIYGKLMGEASVGQAGSTLSVLKAMVEGIGKIAPPWVFQMVIGFYTIEIVFVLSYFISRIEFGHEKVIRDYTIAKNLFFATMIYVVLVLITYYSLNSIVVLV